MASGNGEYRLLEQIEILRERLHRETDFTRQDALKISAELDRLIFQFMSHQNRSSGLD